MSDAAHDIEVELTLLPTEHGGRKGPVSTGYRPQFYYGNEDWDAAHTYIDRGVVHPGQSVKAWVDFFSPQYHRGRVYVGMPFLLREGDRVVGYGRVVKILRLEASAH
jgi:translation elongation factor EF-Tu-like GTPase